MNLKNLLLNFLGQFYAVYSLDVWTAAQWRQLFSIRTAQDEMSSEHFVNWKSKLGLWGFTITAFTEQSPPF